MNNVIRVEKVKKALEEVKLLDFNIGRVEEGVLSSVGRGGSWCKCVNIYISDTKIYGKPFIESQKNLKKSLSEKTGIEEDRIFFIIPNPK